MPDTSSFITTEFNRLTKISFDVRINEVAKNLVSKGRVDNALDIADEHRESIKKLQTSKLFLRQKSLWKRRNAIYSVFPLAFKYFKTQHFKSNQIIAWKSNGFSGKSIKPPTTLDNSLTPGMAFFNGAKSKVKFDGDCVKQEKITFHHKNIV